MVEWQIGQLFGICLLLKHFSSAIEFIAKDSITNAERIRIEILDNIDNLATHPEMHPPDKYKSENNGLYRAFEIYRFRIAYYNGHDFIRIIRFRHTSRERKPIDLDHVDIIPHGHPKRNIVTQSTPVTISLKLRLLHILCV